MQPAGPPIQYYNTRYTGQVFYEPGDPQKEDEAVLAHPKSGPRSNNHRVWFSLLLPLLVHAIVTALTLIFVLVYVDRRDFNISERRPTARLQDGTAVPWTSSAPLQSDITTLLSAAIALLRLVSAGWLGSLCWRCALILMEEIGLRPEQLNSMISYNVPTATLQGETCRKRVTFLLIWVTATIVIPVQLAAPILTGSITWVPGHLRPQPLSDLALPIKQYDNGDAQTLPIEAYNIIWNPSVEDLFLRKDLARTAASFAYLTWERQTQTDLLKRYLPGLRLGVNSTLTNVTLPNLSVHSIEWVNNPKNTLTAEQLDLPKAVCPRLPDGTDSQYCPVYTGLAFFPGTGWSNRNHTWPPKPSIVTERWLLAKRVGYFTGNPENASGCKFIFGGETDLNSIGPDQAVFTDSEHCYLFGWVNFTAGVSTCRDCLVSAYGTVQNQTTLSMERDFLTELALYTVLDVSAGMRVVEDMDMAPAWKNIDEYIVGTLPRAYAASWMLLTGFLGSESHNTTYSLSIPSSKAEVNMIRVYIWLALQSLVPISGILFVYIQSRTNTPIMTNVTLAAFYLDTSAVHEQNEYRQSPVIQRVKLEGERLRLKSE